MKKLFVGNISWNTTEESLNEAFSRFGETTETKIITDRESGRSRGFGFVTFADPSHADAAIEEMNEAELDGRSLTVNEARDKRRGGGFRS